jgi:hypothetical protein
MSDQKHYLFLQHSESVVANMAATVFSGLIQTTPLHVSNEDELIARAVSVAIKIAEQVDKQVESDEEWVRSRKASIV